MISGSLASQAKTPAWPTRCPLDDAWVEHQRVVDVRLADQLVVLTQATANQALTYGVTEAPDARLVTQRALSKSPSAIARDAEHFEFTEKQPSVLMLDHDPRRGEARSAMELDAILCEALPELRPVARAWVPSSSAFIYALDGREVIGPGGWRLYVTVDDASRIPAIGAMIYQALWGSGHGYMTVTKVHHRCQRVAT